MLALDMGLQTSCICTRRLETYTSATPLSLIEYWYLARQAGTRMPRWHDYQDPIKTSTTRVTIRNPVWTIHRHEGAEFDCVLNGLGGDLWLSPRWLLHWMTGVPYSPLHRVNTSIPLPVEIAINIESREAFCDLIHASFFFSLSRKHSVPSW